MKTSEIREMIWKETTPLADKIEKQKVRIDKLEFQITTPPKYEVGHTENGWKVNKRECGFTTEIEAVNYHPNCPPFYKDVPTYLYNLINCELNQVVTNVPEENISGYFSKLTMSNI